MFVVSVVTFARWWGIEGIAVAADITILAGVVALLSFSRRHVRLGLPQMLGWPLAALVAAFAAGIALAAGVQWPSLWWALALKGLGVSAAFVGVLLAAERRRLLQYGRWVLQVFAGLGRMQIP